MKANIADAVYIRFNRKPEESSGLEWQVLNNTFSNLQSLLFSLAKYELPKKYIPDFSLFEIELLHFNPANSLLAFRISRNPKKEFSQAASEQRLLIAEKFDELLLSGNNDGYEGFFEKIKTNEIKQEIAACLYGFIVPARDLSISIVKLATDQTGDLNIEEIYKLPKFSPELAVSLLSDNKNDNMVEEPAASYGLMERFENSISLMNVMAKENTRLSVSFSEMVLPDKVFHFFSPLICTVEQEDGHFILQNESLDLYAAGNSIKQAEYDMAQEFNDTYEHLNNVDDKELSDRLLSSKNMLNAYIKSIKLAS